MPGHMRRAFTLIELLVVVGIISILAAVAVPNFLESQTRSKVARVKNDLKTIASSAEAYRVDFNRYPPMVNFFDPVPSQRLVPLTTPISYITSIPRDPFGGNVKGSYEATIRQIDPNEPLDIYVYNLGSVGFGFEGDTVESVDSQFSLASAGPDRILEFPYYAFSDTFIERELHLVYIYDPTNGTISRGEIFRRGGARLTPVPGLPE